MSSIEFDYNYLVQGELNELGVEQSICEFCPDHFKEEFRSEPLVGKKIMLMQMAKNYYQIHDIKDVIILIDQKHIQCHLLILQCYSKFFASRAQIEKTIELPVEKVTLEAFQKIYSWMLSNQKTVTRNGIIEILMAAEYLLIPLLVQQCWLIIEDCRRFREGY